MNFEKCITYTSKYEGDWILSSKAEEPFTPKLRSKHLKINWNINVIFRELKFHTKYVYLIINVIYYTFENSVALIKDTLFGMSVLKMPLE